MQETIDRIESKFRKTSLSEEFNNASKISAKLPITPVSEWPEQWKVINFKAYPRFPQIDLDKPNRLKMNLETVLKSRFSIRDFAKRAITRKELSTILYYSAGVQRILDRSWNRSFRFYPSAGARYPLEVYPVALRVKGLASGIYHYNVKSNSLEMLYKDDIGDLVYSCIEQEWASNASVFLLISSVFARNEVKYGKRGYRYIMMEAGHLAQNIYLCGAALSVGCCAIGGFIDDKLNKLLDLDGINESIIYVLALGKFSKRRNR